MEDLQVQAKNELTGLNIKDLFFKYIRFLPLFILSVALALTASYIYLRYATLVYRSSASLLIRDEKSGVAAIRTISLSRFLRITARRIFRMRSNSSSPAH